ncbi:MAG: NifB/NifX family molybdenum-iron cluster-binding protein, partial [Candidatus Alkanophagales archaeon]
MRCELGELGRGHGTAGPQFRLQRQSVGTRTGNFLCYEFIFTGGGSAVRVCVTATAEGLDAEVDPRFGRCRYFVIVDTETMEYEAVRNESADAPGGAGVQAAQT